mgnify:CR=1 FL=1
MDFIKSKLKNISQSPVLVATIITAIVLIILLCLYKLDKLDKITFSLINIFLICAIIFGLVWFICDTFVDNKKDHEVDDHIKTYLKNVKNDDDSDNNVDVDNGMKERNGCVQYNYNHNHDPNPNLIPSLNANANLNHNANVFGAMAMNKFANLEGGSNIGSILEEPLTKVPEYRYIARNKIPIPDNIEMFLDRGNL